MARLYILSGASGCGKTTMMNGVCDVGLANRAPKFSERPSRGSDDDIVHVNNIEETDCDLLYVINERRYGLDTKLILSQLERGKDLFIILSDLRLVRRLKAEMGESARAIYISSGIDEEKLREIHLQRHPFRPTRKQKHVLSRQFSRLGSAARLGAWPAVVDAMKELFLSWEDALPEAQSVRVRAQKIRLFHNRYVENISLFDWTVLNYRDPEDMTAQARNILARDRQSARLKKAPPPVFMVCAASGAGKGTLMENLNIMGADEVRIVDKQAKRAPKKGDKRDGMIALGPEGKFGNEFDWRWSFHKGKTFKGVEYAVSRNQIQRNLEQGRSQVFISNMGQISRARKYFGEHLVVVYLHATRTRAEMEAYQYATCKTKKEANSRIRGIDRVHEQYIRNIYNFDHVLLNTTFPEDLYDQMYRLIEHYRNR